MSRVVAITDCDHGTIEPERSVLAGHDVELRQLNCRTAQDVREQCLGTDVIITQYAPVTSDVLAAIPTCRLVVRYGVGVDTIDVDAASARGVWVANVPHYGTAEVAEHAVALGLTMLRGIPLLARDVQAGGWDYRVAAKLHRFSTLTYGVLGIGAIGSAVAARAAALGFQVIGHDPAPPQPAAGTEPLERVSREQLLTQADVLSLHAALDSGSRHTIGVAQLAAMKPTAVLVNTARGGLVDSTALLAALESGRLQGAALDVLEVEPPDAVGQALAAHPRVVVTPHSAWYSEESFQVLKTSVAQEALRVLDGSPPRHPVNSIAASTP